MAEDASTSVGHSFRKSVVVLASGTGAGQLIVLLSSPILTRIYAPADFGLLAVFVSILGIMAPVSTLRYDLALLAPHSDAEANRVFQLCLVTCAIWAMAFGIVMAFGGNTFFEVAGVSSLEQYSPILPLGVFVVGTYQSLNYLGTRQQLFSTIAQTRILQGVGNVATSIGVGLIVPGGVGLLVGYVLGNSLGIGLIARKARWSAAFGRDVVHQLLAVARRYRRYPTYTTPADLLSIAALMLPPIVLAAEYGASVAGWYALTQRIIGSPMSIIGQAFGQVYLGRAARLWQTDQDEFRHLYFIALRRLTLLALATILPLALAAPLVFDLVFGASWRESGRYLQVLAPMFLLQLLVSPLSNTLVLVGQQRRMLLMDAARLLLVVFAVVVSHYLELQPLDCVTSIGVANVLAYLIYAVGITSAVRRC